MTRQLRAALLAGQFSPGDPLPSTRSLAAVTGVSRGTIVAVYEDLAAEGYVESVPGAGTFVTESFRAVSVSAPSVQARTVDEREPPSPSWTGRLIDLSPGAPSTGFSATSSWSAAWRKAVRRELPSSPPPSAGDDELRSLMADHLRRARGVPCDADDIVVTAGTSDGLALILHCLRAEGAAGARIAIENPGYPAARRVIAGLGATAVPIPVRDGGMDVDALVQEPGPLAAALLTPSHQYPLGGRLPVAKRLEVLAWAERTNAVVIEDDYDSEFRHGRPSLPTIASLATSPKVALIGSYSKTLSPWLRCGWLVIKDLELRSRILDMREALGQPVSGLVQVALAEFLRGGDIRRHLIRIGREYARRRSLVISATAALVPRVRLNGIEGGLHATLTWTGGVPDEHVVLRLADHGVRVAPLRMYYHADTQPQTNGIVFGYASPNESDLRTALQSIVAVLHEQ